MPDFNASPDQTLSPSIIRVPLGHGYYALIDAADASLVVQYRWGRMKTGRKTYAVSWSKDADGKTVNTLLHVLLMNPPEGMEVDHRNGDGLDCRRENMRICTEQENCFNRVPKPNTSSRFKGVSRTSTGRWRAQIGHNRRSTHLGTYDTETAAARAYDAKARELFGEFARLNFPDAESEAA
jgi:hypothetical protein